VSRGDGWLGAAVMPLLRPLQRKFLQDHCTAMLAQQQQLGEEEKEEEDGVDIVV
jgi:hypothetical protein